MAATSCAPALCALWGARDASYLLFSLRPFPRSICAICRVFLCFGFRRSRGGHLMSRKPYKHRKRGGGRHVQLHEWVQASEAWATMPPGPRALYVELKRRFNGSNNGEIYLSHRDAAKALNVHRNTVGGWFETLRQRGFIYLATAPHLGPTGVGKASKWRLEELPTPDGKPATKSFMQWREKQNPRTKNRTPRHKKQDTGPNKPAQQDGTVLKFMPLNAQNQKVASQ